jgi:hypothetical protein
VVKATANLAAIPGMASTLDEQAKVEMILSL